MLGKMVSYALYETVTDKPTYIQAIETPIYKPTYTQAIGTLIDEISQHILRLLKLS